MRIGDKIKVLLDRRGMTQRELAKRIGITEVSMSRYVCNARIPKGPLIAAMAKALGVSADELLGLAEGPVISDDKPPSAQPEQRYTEEELRVFQHGISLSLLSKRSSQHWQYDEDMATEIKFLERLYEKVGADIRSEHDG